MRTEMHRNIYTIGIGAWLVAISAWAQNTTPETLTLTHNARWALNGLLGTMDDRGEFMFRCSLVPPSISYDAFSFSACGPKYLESLAMMSVMTGVDLNHGKPRKAIDYLVSCLGEDGLFYCKIGPERPWDTSSPEDWANMYGQGRMIRAMLALYQVNPTRMWEDRLKKLVSTLERIVIRKVDPDSGETYAYYPTTPGYGDIFSYPKSGWKVTDLLIGAQETMADLPDHSFGIPLYLGGLIEPLTRYAVTFNDPQALELAGQLVWLVLKKENAWEPDGCAKGVVPEQNGQFYGHFHAHTNCLRGILEYGIATNDSRLKQLARSGYEFARTLGIPRIGWFPEYTGKASHETCGLANMVALAIKLSRAGIGDYWDDVDCYVRNHLTEAQFTDIQEFINANNGQLTTDQLGILKGLMGTFAGWGSPNSLVIDQIMNCCTANGSQAIYYVWDSILEENHGTVTVNLLLNRLTPWLDVESRIPREGRLICRNKKASRLLVRMPGWVDRSHIRVTRNGDMITASSWVERFVLIEDLQPGDIIEITFPMIESMENYVVEDFGHRGTTLLSRQTYTINFAGNTAVGILPKATQGHPTYQRESSRRVPEIFTKSEEKVPEKRIIW